MEDKTIEGGLACESLRLYEWRQLRLYERTDPARVTVVTPEKRSLRSARANRTLSSSTHLLLTPDVSPVGC